MRRGQGCTGMPVLCTLQGCCNPPYPAFHLGSELIPPSSLSRVGGSPDCHLPLLSLALPLSPWNFYESVLSLYMEKRVSRRRVVIFTGALFSGNRELPTGRRGRGRMVLIFREESEARRGWFLGIALLSFAMVFFFVIVQKRNKFYQFSIGDTLSRSAF